jgi:hypothetical protein
MVIVLVEAPGFEPGEQGFQALWQETPGQEILRFSAGLSASTEAQGSAVKNRLIPQR